ncbi:type VI secretion protein [Klebsiella pneumoniae]|nr:type VI secretion protein [Klebsiella pneumoniae]
MKIFRPLWRDGAFLVPQQFQQQARWDAHVADTVSRMALAHPWGVLRAEFGRERAHPFPAQRHPADRAFRRRNAD